MRHAVFVLGPGHWRRARDGPTPLDLRRSVAAAVREAGHEAFLMEDEPPPKPRNQMAKFLDLVARSTDVWVVWPLDARMPTTVGEMNVLRALVERGERRPMVLFYQDGVAEVRRGRLHCIEPEGQNSYLQDLIDHGLRVQPWKDAKALVRAAGRIAADL